MKLISNPLIRHLILRIFAKLCYNILMKIGILGFGKEGQSAKEYFTTKGDEITVFDNFTATDLGHTDFSNFDMILRSPSVPPHPQFSSMTRYFFDRCPCPIIGVTGTKGKGTTCSIITDLLRNLQQDVYLVGNIGNPALNILDQLTPSSVVVYEMSSFQLWDLEKSPHIAVVLGIEPDHLNIHRDFQDYIDAKANICKHQLPQDYCIYYHNNSDTVKIAAQSPATHQYAYPVPSTKLKELLQHLAIPGQHNQDNAEAALFAVASFFDQPIDQFIQQHQAAILKTFENFQGLPHRLQYLRTLNDVKYYDDNFSTTLTSLEVALKSFPKQNLVLIVGGRDKTNGTDLPEIINLAKSHTTKTILLGESGHEIAKILTNLQNSPDLSDAELSTILEKTTSGQFHLASTLPQAVQLAKNLAEDLQNHQENTESVIVLMSPAAASFDMFDNVYARGAEFQKLIQELS